MTVQLGDTGKVAYGTQKTFAITIAAPRETLDGSPTVLPTTEPATSQISFTVQTSDLPTITPSPNSMKYVAILYGAGKNTDAASQTVSYRILKNGVSVATGSITATPTNNFYTVSCYQFYDVVVGDVLELRLWATSANVNYDYYAIAVLPTRVSFGKAYLNKDVVYGSAVTALLISGTPNAVSSPQPYIYPTTSNTLNLFSAGITVNALNWHSTYNAFQAYHGDNQLGVIGGNHATNRPSYRGGTTISSISFREVLR